MENKKCGKIHTHKNEFEILETYESKILKFHYDCRKLIYNALDLNTELGSEGIFNKSLDKEMKRNAKSEIEECFIESKRKLIFELYNIAIEDLQRELYFVTMELESNDVINSNKM